MLNIIYTHYMFKYIILGIHARSMMVLWSQVYYKCTTLYIIHKCQRFYIVSGLDVGSSLAQQSHHLGVTVI